MSAQGKIKTLFSDKEKTEPLYPRTKMSAISNNDGIGLEAILDGAVYSDNNVIQSTVVPVNADTLGGRKASEYATNEFVIDKITEAQLSGGSGEIDLSGYVTEEELRDAVEDIDFPVGSVNGRVGEVQLTASDVGAHPNTWMPTASEVGAAPASHTNDENNPHGVTIEQIGAAPASHTNDENNPHGVTIEQIGAAPASHTNDENNPHSVTWDQTGAAPAGYGYGEIPVNLGSVTDDAAFLVALNELFAKTVSRTRMVTFARNGNGWVGTLWNAGNGYGALTAYCYAGDNSSQFSKLVRNCKNGVWYDWEFENPPLKNNTEYLTTERCDGKPVYIKRVDLGALPNTSNKRQVIAPTGSTIVGIDGYSVYTSSAGNEIYTPLVKTEGVTSFFMNKTTGQVGINTDTDLSTYTATVTVKYTK